MNITGIGKYEVANGKIVRNAKLISQKNLKFTNTMEII